MSTEPKEDSLTILEFKESDRLLPQNNITRIIRHSLPPGVKISSEVKDRMLEATSELIGFLTNNAVEEYMLPSKRKTLSDQDLIKSLIQLDLNIFVPPLNAYLKNQKSLRNKNKIQSNHNDGKDEQKDEDPDNDMNDLNDNDNLQNEQIN